ncbi:MAG: hypothetical protein HGA42_17755, partial [Nostocales cyanobacterium W4_Combined_metabat2_030]|nr:hypothetical protein [Nostocales cyanobacterium W4_Combined_metabat2_030]
MIAVVNKTTTTDTIVTVGKTKPACIINDVIYSRINNPDIEILENRLCLWDEAEEAAAFESGMSAITTVLLEFLKPG